MTNIEYSENKEVAIFNGRKYYLRKSQGYYYAPRKHRKGCDLLHRMVYICENGEIPKGYHIHHIDGNKFNNDISNLKCIPEKEHKKIHTENMSEELKEKLRKNMEEVVRPKANIWHGTADGRECHKMHYEMMKDKLYERVTRKCTVCGKEYKTTRKNEAKYCSLKCAAKARRESGLDDEIRICENCGKEFTINKYRKTKCCSKKCAAELKKHKQKEFICVNCGTKFLAPVNSSAKYCSDKCRKEYKHILYKGIDT